MDREGWDGGVNGAGGMDDIDINGGGPGTKTSFHWDCMTAPTDAEVINATGGPGAIIMGSIEDDGRNGVDIARDMCN